MQVYTKPVVVVQGDFSAGMRRPRDCRAWPSWRVRLVVVLVALTAGSTLSGPAATIAYGARGPVELLSGTGPQSIPLTVFRVAPSNRLVIGGVLHLMFENITNKPQHVRVQYARTSSRSVESLPEQTVPAYAARQVSIRLHLPAYSAPEAFDGTLDVHVFSGIARRPAQEFTLPLTGRLKPVGDVRFQPSGAVIQVTKLCLFALCNASSGGSVRLYGTGVGELLAQMRAAGISSLMTQLRRGGTRPITAEIADVRMDPTLPGTATGELKFKSPNVAGSYTGAVSVSPLVANSPSWPIDVRSRVWIVWAVLLIVVGVVISGFVTQNLGLGRRKKLLRGALKDVVDQSVRMRPDNRRLDGERLIWGLGIKHDLRYNPEWSYYTRLDTADNIYTAVRWARNEKDLDEAEDHAHKLMARISDWQAALSAVRALSALKDDKQRDPPDEWDETKCAFDTDVMLRKVRHQPSDSTASSQLVEQVRRQTAWNRRLAGAWDLRKRLRTIADGASDTITRAEIDGGEIDEIDANIPPITSRSQEQQDEFDVKLDRALAKLVALSEKSNRDEETPEVIMPQLPAAELEADAATFDANAKAFRSAGDTPAFAIAELDVRSALTMDEGEAGESPEPRPVSRPAGVRVISRTTERVPWRTGAERAVREKVRTTKQRAGHSVSLLRRFWWTDWLLSLAIIGLSSVLYAATIYGDTWGTATDVATAFGAGFTGHVAIKWGLLPIYRSVRLGATPSAAGATATGAGDEGRSS